MTKALLNTILANSSIKLKWICKPERQTLWLPSVLDSKNKRNMYIYWTCILVRQDV